MRDPPGTQPTMSPQSRRKTRDRNDHNDDREHDSRPDAPQLPSGKTGSYRSPPWTFTGKALYQLSLVRIEDARKYVPDAIPLVNIFGYTLGGFYLARYSGSPAGQFDELVALAGLAWNFPTSCAWAARVYVNNDEAKRHGLKVVGLPSRKARFTRSTYSNSPSTTPASSSTSIKKPTSDWWGPLGPHEASAVHIYNTDAPGNKHTPICSIDLSSTMRHDGNEVGRGLRAPPTSIRTLPPKIQMFLPSFSGATALCPDILKYSLRLSTRIRFLKPIQVITPPRRDDMAEKQTTDGSIKAVSLVNKQAAGDDIEAFIGQHVLHGRPLLCMSFDDMTMDVEAPERMAT